MKRCLTFAAVIAGVCLATGECAAAATVPRGYAASYTDLSIPTWFGGFDYLPDGRLIISDSTDVYALEADGTKTVLAHFEQPGLFGSFVEVPPYGKEVFVGESSVGTISRFMLGSGDVCSIGPGTPSVIAELPFNYDMDFGPPYDLPYVSAAVPGSDPPTNGLYALHKSPWRVDLIAEVRAWSGPLAFDEKGNLFYCTATTYPPQEVESVIFFRRDQVEAALWGTVLHESDAQVLVSGIYGLSDMCFVSYGHLFGVTSSGRIMEVSVEGEKVTCRGFASVSPDALGATVVRYVPGKRPFGAYYQEGGTLTFLESDFGSLCRLVHVATSTSFEITLLEPSAEGLKIAFAAEEGIHYQLCWSEGAGGVGGWHELGDVVAGEGVPITVVDRGDLIAGIPSPASPSVRQRFYRVEKRRQQ